MPDDLNMSTVELRAAAVLGEKAADALEAKSAPDIIPPGPPSKWTLRQWLTLLAAIWSSLSVVAVAVKGTAEDYIQQQVEAVLYVEVAGERVLSPDLAAQVRLSSAGMTNSVIGAHVADEQAHPPVLRAASGFLDAGLMLTRADLEDLESWTTLHEAEARRLAQDVAVLLDRTRRP